MVGPTNFEKFTLLTKFIIFLKIVPLKAKTWSGSNQHKIVEEYSNIDKDKKKICLKKNFGSLVSYWFFIASTIPDDSLEDGLKKYSNISCVVFILGFGVFVQQLSYFFLPSATESHDEISVILHHLMYFIGIILWYRSEIIYWTKFKHSILRKCSSSTAPTNIAMATF